MAKVVREWRGYCCPSWAELVIAIEDPDEVYLTLKSGNSMVSVHWWPRHYTHTQLSWELHTVWVAHPGSAPGWEWANILYLAEEILATLAAIREEAAT